jgi:hypothetical protein
MPKDNSLEEWKREIEEGIRYKEKYGESERWKTYRDYGRGIFPGFTGSNSGILPYNVTYEMKSNLVPNVYFRNPYVSVSPRYKPGFHINAKVVEAVDNWLIQELGIKASMKTAVTDCFYTNRGILKTGYEGSTGKGGFFKSIVETFKGNKEPNKTQYDVNVKVGMPWVSRVIPDHFIVPFGVRTLENCEWVDHVVMRKLEDVKEDKKYTNTKDLQGTHFEMLYKDKSYANFYKELTTNTPFVEIHEIHDYKRKEIKAFVPGHEGWIRGPEEDVNQIEGLPFVDFTFNEDTEYYWGPSDVKIIEPQQLEINETRTQAMLHRRIALVKFLADANMITSEEVDKMMSENVGPVVFVKGDPNKAVNILQPHIPADLTQWSEIIRTDVRSLLGHSRQSSGEAPPGRRTKYEMQVVFEGRELRLDERRDIVADALVKVIRKVNQTIFDRWDTEQVAQVVGYDGARYWVKYIGKDNAAEYNVKVDVESMTPSTKAMKKQEIVQVIQALANNPRANIDYLMRLLLREYEWMDAMQILPEAQETMGGPMGQSEFVGMQNKMLQNPALLKERAGRNAQMIGNVM